MLDQKGHVISCPPPYEDMVQNTVWVSLWVQRCCSSKMAYGGCGLVSGGPVWWVCLESVKKCGAEAQTGCSPRMFHLIWQTKILYSRPSYPNPLSRNRWSLLGCFEINAFLDLWKRWGTNDWSELSALGFVMVPRNAYRAPGIRGIFTRQRGFKGLCF